MAHISSKYKYHLRGLLDKRMSNCLFQYLSHTITRSITYLLQEMFELSLPRFGDFPHYYHVNVNITHV